MRLYDTRLSGNSWKVRLLLRHLRVDFERVTLDLAKGDQNDPAFKSKSLFARVPVLELDDGRTIVESGAILLYLAQGTAFLPEDPVLRADVTAWMFFEQADLLKALGLPRFWHLRGIVQEKRQQIADYHAQGYAGLDKMEAWLASHDWLAADRYTIADIGMFPYVFMAREGGYDMQRYPAIATWMSRIEAQPGYVPLIEES